MAKIENILLRRLAANSCVDGKTTIEKHHRITGSLVCSISLSTRRCWLLLPPPLLLTRILVHFISFHFAWHVLRSHSLVTETATVQVILFRLLCDVIVAHELASPCVCHKSLTCSNSSSNSIEASKFHWNIHTISTDYKSTQGMLFVAQIHICNVFETLNWICCIESSNGNMNSVLRQRQSLWPEWNVHVINLYVTVAACSSEPCDVPAYKYARVQWAFSGSMPLDISMYCIRLISHRPMDVPYLQDLS